jgi:hypothetical protein
MREAVEVEMGSGDYSKAAAAALAGSCLCAALVKTVSGRYNAASFP